MDFRFQSRISHSAQAQTLSTQHRKYCLEKICVSIPFTFHLNHTHKYKFHANLKNGPQSFLINFQLFLHDNFSFSLHQRHTLTLLAVQNWLLFQSCLVQRCTKSMLLPFSMKLTWYCSARFDCLDQSILSVTQFLKSLNFMFSFNFEQCCGSQR